MGADKNLADYKQIVSYFRALAAGSPRVQIEALGKTTLGEDIIMAVISSEANMRNLRAIKEIAKQLADPRGLSDAQIDALVREGKAVVLVTCNIHSSEIASSQMAMEWAYALATATDAETKRRLDNVVLLLVPSLNPDGQIMITDWYRKYLGTRYEGGRLPWLYHHYVGHDNNRDWYMLTQIETKALSRAVYHEWYPQVFVDEHQMGTDGPRMFIPPFADPVDPDVHPLIWREANLIGIEHGVPPRAAEQGGADLRLLVRRVLARRHAQHRLVEEHHGPAAGDRVGAHRDADHTSSRPSCAAARRGSSSTRPPSIIRIRGRAASWRMRDIMDYERIASDALLETAARSPRGFAARHRCRARARRSRWRPTRRRTAFRTISATGRPRRCSTSLLLEHGVEMQQAGERRLLDPDGAAVLEVRHGDARAAALSGSAAAAGERDPAAVRRRDVDAAAGDGRHGRDADAAAALRDARHVDQAGDEGSPREAREATRSRASRFTTRGAARSMKGGRAGCSTSTASRRSRCIRRM